MRLQEQTTGTTRIYEGKIVNLRKDTVVLENGAPAIREVVEHPGGVCIVPITDDGCILMVRQFRYPFQEVLMEVPAGKLEKGEDPAEAGIRELSEELGAEAREFTSMGVIYPTVAYLTEKIYMYLAKGLTFTQQHLDEDEFLEVVKMPLAEALQKVLAGEIPDSKTQIAILKVAVSEGLVKGR